MKNILSVNNNKKNKKHCIIEIGFSKDQSKDHRTTKYLTMLRKLGFSRFKELATETSLELPEHVTTKVRNRTCFIGSETTKELINLRSFPVKSSFSLSVNYQINKETRHETLSGHIFPFPVQRPNLKLQLFELKIPILFLVNEPTFRDHIRMVLSETFLAHSTQERLVSHISKNAIQISRHRRGPGGFRIEVDIKVEVDHFLGIGCCKRKEACPWRVVRYVAERVTGMDCPICLTELSTAVSRMELRCSYLFHKVCVMKWLKENNSCPICRAEAIGKIASIY